MYVWTKKAEEHWQKCRPKERWHERKTGEQALFDGVPIEDDKSPESIFSDFVRCGWIARQKIEIPKKKEMDIPPRFRRKMIQRWKLIQNLRKAGIPYKRIAIVLGMSRAAVMNWVCENRKKYTSYFGEIK